VTTAARHPTEYWPFYELRKQYRVSFFYLFFLFFFFT
jgi:hypothetical protein